MDGDTVELGNGETVRLVGIDAPEAGECGHERAADSLVRMVLRQAVLLGESDEDRDRYGRLLRYVDIGRQDAGLRLIKNGLAIARYDSRDGYGFHPREARYVAADKGAKQLVCDRSRSPSCSSHPPATAHPATRPASRRTRLTWTVPTSTDRSACPVRIRTAWTPTATVSPASSRAHNGPMDAAQENAGVVNLDDKLALFSDHWSPKVVARLNDYEIKVVKIQGRVRLALPRGDRRAVPGDRRSAHDPAAGR